MTAEPRIIPVVPAGPYPPGTEEAYRVLAGHEAVDREGNPLGFELSLGTYASRERAERVLDAFRRGEAHA